MKQTFTNQKNKKLFKNKNQKNKKSLVFLKKQKNKINEKSLFFLKKKYQLNWTDLKNIIADIYKEKNSKIKSNILLELKETKIFVDLLQIHNNLKPYQKNLITFNNNIIIEFIKKQSILEISDLLNLIENYKNNNFEWKLFSSLKFWYKYKTKLKEEDKLWLWTTNKEIFNNRKYWGNLFKKQDCNFIDFKDCIKQIQTSKKNYPIFIYTDRVQQKKKHLKHIKNFYFIKIIKLIKTAYQNVMEKARKKKQFKKALSIMFKNCFFIKKIKYLNNIHYFFILNTSKNWLGNQVLQKYKKHISFYNNANYFIFLLKQNFANNKFYYFIKNLNTKFLNNNILYFKALYIYFLQKIYYKNLYMFHISVYKNKFWSYQSNKIYINSFYKNNLLINFEKLNLQTNNYLLNKQQEKNLVINTKLINIFRLIINSYYLNQVKIFPYLINKLKFYLINLKYKLFQNAVILQTFRFFWKKLFYILFYKSSKKLKIKTIYNFVKMYYKKYGIFFIQIEKLLLKLFTSSISVFNNSLQKFISFLQNSSFIFFDFINLKKINSKIYELKINKIFNQFNIWNFKTNKLFFWKFLILNENNKTILNINTIKYNILNINLYKIKNYIEINWYANSNLFFYNFNYKDFIFLNFSKNLFKFFYVKEFNLISIYVKSYWQKINKIKWLFKNKLNNFYLVYINNQNKFFLNSFLNVKNQIFINKIYFEENYWIYLKILKRKKAFRKRIFSWMKGFKKRKIFKFFVRRIKKHKAFIKILRIFLEYFTGFNEKYLMFLWLKFRRGSNKYWMFNNLVEKFSQSLLLQPLNFLLILGIAPSIYISKILISSGFLIINGKSSINYNSYLKSNDIFQINPKLIKYIQNIFKYHHWSTIKYRLNNLNFLQIDWSLLIFSLLYWPYSYELIAPSFISERWIRYYIHQYPIRIKRYRSIKTDWKIYSKNNI